MSGLVLLIACMSCFGFGGFVSICIYIGAGRDGICIEISWVARRVLNYLIV